MNIVTLDIETSLTFAEAQVLNPENPILAFAKADWIAVTKLHGKLERWCSWNYKALDLLTYLEQADSINGWNIESFDIPIIAETFERQHERKFKMNPRVQDIFQIASRVTKTPERKHGMAYKLEEVATINGLGSKLMDSSRIPEIFRSGDLETVFAHCERDVMLEQEIGILACAGSLVLPEKTDKNGIIPQSILTMPEF